MSNLGEVCRAAAAQLGIEDSERAAVQLRLAARQTIRANQMRNLFWNVKELTITPLVVGQYIYPQGSGGGDLPEDWLAPAAYLDDCGAPTAWITTTADTDTKYKFLLVTPGEYRRQRAEYGSVDGRPRAWTIIDEGLHLVPSPDETTYIITLAYIYDASKSFSYGIDSTTGAWSGSNDTYTDDWFAEDKGFHLMVEAVCKRMLRTPMGEPQKAQGPAQGEAEQLFSMTSRSEKNNTAGRIAFNW